MKSLRTERLSSEYRKEIAEIISNSLKNKCPELYGLISVTEADVAPDLKNAKVFLSIYDKDEERKAKTFDIIKENAGFIRNELAHRMKMRTVPVLHFLMDNSMEYGDKIDNLIKKLHQD